MTTPHVTTAAERISAARAAVRLNEEALRRAREDEAAAVRNGWRYAASQSPLIVLRAEGSLHTAILHLARLEMEEADRRARRRNFALAYLTTAALLALYLAHRAGG